MSLSTQLMTDAVVAQYIHDISTDRRPRPARAENPADAHSVDEIARPGMADWLEIARSPIWRGRPLVGHLAGC